MTSARAGVEIYALPGLPEVRHGDDLGALILDAVAAADLEIVDGDVLVVSSKVVSKAGGLRAPSATRAAEVLRRSRRVVAERTSPAGLTRIVESLAGPVLAAAGIDASNTGDGGDTVLLLPTDPDDAAAVLHRDVRDPLLPRRPRFAVVLSDTAGRPWRVGQTDFALGSSGFDALDDLRGSLDADGRALAVTTRAVADEVAAAADLVKGKAGGVAAALVRGVAASVVDTPAASAADLVRTGPGDWFALGHVEAVRAALGVEPGTAAAVEVGLPPVGVDDAEARIRRACALALHAPDARGLAATAAAHPRGHLFDTPAVQDVEATLVQTGVHLTAPDDYRLGQAVARLCVALASEGMRGWPARREQPARAGRAEALVLVG